MGYIPEWIYIIDILFFFVVLLAVLRGIRRGFYRELAGVLAFILLMYGYYFGYPSLNDFMGRTLSSLAWLAQSAAALLVLVFLTVVFYLGVRIFSEQVLQARLGVFTDRFSGLIMGFVRGVVLLVVFLAVLSEFPNEFLYDIFTSKSAIGEFLSNHLLFLAPGGGR